MGIYLLFVLILRPFIWLLMVVESIPTPSMNVGASFMVLFGWDGRVWLSMNIYFQNDGGVCSRTHIENYN